MKLPNYKEARKRDKQEVLVECYNPLDLIERLVDGKYYYIKTFGCQMNEHDSENMSALVERLGYIFTEDIEKADLILVNTCSIRENAHNKTFGFLGSLKNLKKEKEDLLICVGGCMSQEEGVVKQLQEKYKWIDVVFGTHNIYDLPYLIKQALLEPGQQIEVLTKMEKVVESIPVRRSSPIQAYVNIIFGCNKFCTYCIVPFTRGKELSRKEEDILKEVEELVNQGYLEITLLGQNVNAYGKDINKSLASLLEKVAQYPIPRIKFMTSHPWDFTDELIEVMAKYPNILPYLHLPVQSGSNTVLKKMGRRYTRDEYLELVHKIKEKIPNITLTTDIIVGFPGETEEDFQETLSLVNEVKYAGAYTFIYSPRENTLAAKFEDIVPDKISKDRLHILNNLINKYALMDNQQYLNTIASVLILGKSKKDNCYMGYTEHNKLVNVRSDINITNKLVNVKINNIKTWSMDGEVLLED